MWPHLFLTLPIFALLEREAEGSSGECCNMPCTFLYSLGGTAYLLIRLAIFIFI